MKHNQKISYSFISSVILSLLVIVSCSNTDFSSAGQIAKKAAAKKEAPGDQIPTLSESENIPPPDLETDTGGLKFSGPDYSQCAKLPSGGYTKGGGQCDANQVIVIINDGKSAGKTCCPIGKNVLSTVPAEMNQVRQGTCLADEVSTGISTMTAPFCTKINTQFLKLQSVGVATYGVKSSAGALGPLAKIYHKEDCCACPEGSVTIGGHTLSDNQCADQCVKIIQK